MHQPFRFIHASDLHLERVLHAASDVPETWRESLIEAPYRAASRIFDTAITERVDFVVLAGETIDPLAAGPRGLVFLEEQFARLAAAGINIYWAGGPADRFDPFRTTWRLGENVVRFPLDHVAYHVHHRNGQPLVHIAGRSSARRTTVQLDGFRETAGELFCIAVAHGRANLTNLAECGINYWALGGRHRRRSVVARRTTVHYPGESQARHAQATGPRGCTLVDVDAQQRVRLHTIATDAVRYVNEPFRADPGLPYESIFQRLSERVRELASDAFGPELLISITISGDRTLDRALRHGPLASEWMTRLRAEHGAKRPAAWIDSLAAASHDLPGEWYAEHTVRGEFLRTVQEYALDTDRSIDFATPASHRPKGGWEAWQWDIQEPRARMHLLAEAAQLGAELLGGADELLREETRR